MCGTNGSAGSVWFSRLCLCVDDQVIASLNPILSRHLHWALNPAENNLGAPDKWVTLCADPQTSLSRVCVSLNGEHDGICGSEPVPAQTTTSEVLCFLINMKQ